MLQSDHRVPAFCASQTLQEFWHPNSWSLIIARQLSVRVTSNYLSFCLADRYIKKFIEIILNLFYTPIELSLWVILLLFNSVAKLLC
jgi:hypothetical protein